MPDYTCHLGQRLGNNIRRGPAPWQGALGGVEKREGDVEGAIAGAERRVLGGTVRVPGTYHMYLEPQASSACLRSVGGQQRPDLL